MTWDLSDEFMAQAGPEAQAFDPANPQPGHYIGISDADYHGSPGINNSGLSLVSESVSDFIQYRDSPKDPEKLKVFDFGSAAHMATTQYDRFITEYIRKPMFNLRTNKGKADSEAWDREHATYEFILSEDDYKKIMLMRDCIMADPRARLWLEQDGLAESAVYWNDNETGQLCKLKADWLVELPDLTVCVDFKSTDSIAKFRKDFFSLRYDVQDCHYSTGLAAHFNKPVLFLFLACSKTIELGRYPTWCGNTPAEDREISRVIWRNDMNKLATAIRTDDWIEYNTIERSAAAREYTYAKYSK